MCRNSDIKPHNFVITPSAHILLIDFGSAAPLLPPLVDKRRLVPKQYCRAPCGTCDYIAPEVLIHFEQDMINFEAGESTIDQSGSGHDDAASSTVVSQPSGLTEGCYGMEVDWWSLGVLVYELYYGIAPFFAEDIKKTYERIVHHEVRGNYALLCTILITCFPDLSQI
jgi:serine/threonine protein kinase